MATATTHPDDAPTSGLPQLQLQAGVSHALWAHTERSGTAASGEVRFRGRPVRITVPDRDAVLFPTDVGLSLLAALDQPDDPGRSIPLDGRRVLDVGCGSGLHAIALLQAGCAHVTAVDRNPACAEVTAANARDNHINSDQLDIRTADITTLPITSPYDLVIANPPHLPADASYDQGHGLDAALLGGADGRQLYDVLVRRARDLLAPGGTMLLAHSSLTGIPRTCQQLLDQGLQVQALLDCHLDLPLERYASGAPLLHAKLTRLRDRGQAIYTGNRFFVRVLAITCVG